MPIEAPTIKRLTSDYLLPAIDTGLKYAYRITIADLPGKPGFYQLMVDPNSCFLDDFGQAQGCTLMALFPFEVRLQLVLTDGNRTLYDLISDQELPARFRLALLGDPSLRACPARMLTLDEDDYITQIVHLHPEEDIEPDW